MNLCAYNVMRSRSFTSLFLFIVVNISQRKELAPMYYQNNGMFLATMVMDEMSEVRIQSSAAELTASNLKVIPKASSSVGNMLVFAPTKLG